MRQNTISLLNLSFLNFPVAPGFKRAQNLCEKTQLKVRFGLCAPALVRKATRSCHATESGVCKWPSPRPRGPPVREVTPGTRATEKNAGLWTTAQRRSPLWSSLVPASLTRRGTVHRPPVRSARSPRRVPWSHSPAQRRTRSVHRPGRVGHTEDRGRSRTRKLESAGRLAASSSPAGWRLVRCLLTQLARLCRVMQTPPLPRARQPPETRWPPKPSARSPCPSPPGWC